jgi:hypothetical protein
MILDTGKRRATFSLTETAAIVLPLECSRLEHPLRKVDFPVPTSKRLRRSELRTEPLVKPLARRPEEARGEEGDTPEGCKKEQRSGRLRRLLARRPRARAAKKATPEGCQEGRQEAVDQEDCRQEGREEGAKKATRRRLQRRPRRSAREEGDTPEAQRSAAELSSASCYPQARPPPTTVPA